MYDQIDQYVVRIYTFVYCRRWARIFVTPAGVITWHRVFECLVSVSKCVIYILPLLLIYNYDDVVAASCHMQHLLYALSFFLLVDLFYMHNQLAKSIKGCMDIKWYKIK